jgi:hypothetical protein
MNIHTHSSIFSRWKALCSVIILLSAGAASARLGESPVEIMNRYGAVQNRSENGTNRWVGTYLFKEYGVVVYFQTNRCVAEVVQPIERRNLGDDEVKALMKNIGGNESWIKDESDFEFLAGTWFNTQSKAVARLERKIMGKDTLMVMTMEFVKQDAAAQKKKEKSKAEGF